MGIDQVAGLRRAVFLDRDGVLNACVVRNGKPYPPASRDEVVVLEGVVEACTALKALGAVLVMVTNQPDVARGTQSRATVDEINAYLAGVAGIDRVFCCFHDDGDRCACRKPLSGMLLDAASALGLELRSSFMVGDRWRDIDAGAAAGCKTIFIDYGYAETLRSQPDFVVKSLREAVPLVAHTWTHER